MRYYVCEYCGANLDCNERCDCKELNIRQKKKHSAQGPNFAKCPIKNLRTIISIL